MAIKVYPDIEWTVELTIGEQPNSYSHAGMPKGASFKKHEEKAKEYEEMSHLNISDIKIGFKLEAEFNDGQKSSLNKEFENRVQGIIGLLGKIKSGLDSISGKDNLPKASNFTPQMHSLLKSPVFLEISNPEVSISGSWKFIVAKNKLDLVREGTISFGFTPLVKAKGGIDLVAASQFIPVVGQVITAIEKANRGLKVVVKYLSDGKIKIESDLWFNLYAFGEISCKGEINLGEETEAKIESTTTVGLGIELGIKLGIEVSTIEVKGNQGSSIAAGLDAEAKAETSVSFSGKYGIDSIGGPFIGFGITFDGLIITVTGKATISRVRKNKKASSGFESSTPFKLIGPTPILDKKIYLLPKN